MGFLPAAPQPLVSQFSLLRERRRDGDSPSSSSPPPPPLRPRPFQTPLRRHRRVRNLPRSFPPPISPTLPYALDSERLLRLRFAAEGSSSRNRIVELLALGIGTPFASVHRQPDSRFQVASVDASPAHLLEEGSRGTSMSRLDPAR
uniref:Uncharacterized protein n=1 Tax=Leersia perrieri TaxID=77586 RepID=A0A0D9VDV7_9ORYZ